MKRVYYMGKTAAIDIGMGVENDGEIVPGGVMNPPALPAEDGTTDTGSGTKGQVYPYYGFVVDSSTGQPIPGATVAFLINGTKKAQIAANSSGYFEYTAEIVPIDQIAISSASYIDNTFPASTYQHTFELEPDIHQLDPVVLTAHKQNWLLLLALVAVVVYESNKGKKKVGKIETSTILFVGSGLIGFSIVKKLLESLGIWQGEGVKKTKEEQTNPNSPWKPEFYKAAPTGSTIFTMASAQTLAAQIHGAFTIFQDDFNKIFAAFTQCKTQSQVSFLADVFQQKYGEDLLSFLTDGGGIMPWDGLNSGHMKTILDYVSNLPKYKP